jgi:hypothetical protein
MRYQIAFEPKQSDGVLAANAFLRYFEQTQMHLGTTFRRLFPAAEIFAYRYSDRSSSARVFTAISNVNGKLLSTQFRRLSTLKLIGAER